MIPLSGKRLGGDGTDLEVLDPKNLNHQSTPENPCPLEKLHRFRVWGLG